MKLYHATTPLQAAMLWSLSIEGSRTVFLELNCNETINDKNIHKLPDHHNQFGEAWWIDENVNCDNYKCVLSAK